ncbi:MAG: hypothetical protein ACOVQ7_18160, partial [Limnoraphis robusta]
IERYPLFPNKPLNNGISKTVKSRVHQTTISGIPKLKCMKLMHHSPKKIGCIKQQFQEYPS